MSEAKKLLVVLGPTATGKTDLALLLARKLNGELVSCDSRQVYKGLDIGTGKHPGQKAEVTKGKGYWEIDGIKIWMYDVADPKKQYSVADYIKEANIVLEQIQKGNRLPIVVGGTGFYLKGLLEGFSNLGVPFNKKLRQRLDKLSVGELQQRLKTISKEKFESLNESDRKNPRRLLRSIEVVSMYPYMIDNQNLKFKSQNYNILKIGLTAPRQILNNRIDSRVLSRLGQGMIEEGKSLQNSGLTFKQMRELGLEYAVIADFLEGNIKSLEQFILVLQTKIHQYAKRQMTWFKKENGVEWFDVSDKDFVSQVEKKVLDWYNSYHEQVS